MKTQNNFIFEAIKEFFYDAAFYFSPYVKGWRKTALDQGKSSFRIPVLFGLLFFMTLIVQRTILVQTGLCAVRIPESATGTPPER